MTLSDMYADASAAIIVSAQTGQVGRSVPRRAECVRAVDGISAIAGIVTSSLLFDFSPGSSYSHRLTMSQHKYVSFTILVRRASLLQCNGLLPRAALALARRLTLWKG
jgi:hypothetical protein